MPWHSHCWVWLVVTGSGDVFVGVGCPHCGHVRDGEVWLAQLGDLARAEESRRAHDNGCGQVHYLAS